MSCEDCRMQAQVSADLDPLGDLRPGDEDIVAAAAEAVVSGLGRIDRPMKRAMPGFLAIVVWIGVSAVAVAAGQHLVRLARVAARARSADSFAVHRERDSRISSRPTKPPPSAGLSSATDIAAVPVPSATFQEPSALAEPSISLHQVRIATREALDSRDLPLRDTRIARVSRFATGGRVVPASSLDPTARDLLAAGTAARARGDWTEAVASFRRLHDLYPGSVEAQVALISSGQLLLDRGAFEAAADAFGEYRRAAPRGALEEEALDGLGRSLAGLRRFDDERRIWRELMVRFPHSAYLPRARLRLAGAP